MIPNKMFKKGDKVHLIEDSKADIFGMPSVSKDRIGVVIDVKDDTIYVEFPDCMQGWAYAKYFELA